jgi:penicillin-insensitive murein endopeptidase
MRRAQWLLPILAALLLLGPPHGDAQARAGWSDVKAPLAGATESIGAPSAGCIRGARALPLSSAGYWVVGASRRRFFGHPALVAYVERLGRSLLAAGMAGVSIGDLGQPRGGPMPLGHASHQNGLDVDVSFDLAPKPRRRARATESVGRRTLVEDDNRSVDPTRWRPEHARVLALAAAPNEVDRIFVHPAIKQQLCATESGERAWLEKIRPWYGHDEHFHVRLRCPAGSPACLAGPPVPAGDGCDESLAWWFEAEEGRLHAWREVDPRPPSRGTEREPEPLPAACNAVLVAP